MKTENALSAYKRILVLCPHTDDEFGCAGTIIKLAKMGGDIRYIALSRCEESVPQGFPKNILDAECRKCTAAMGIKPKNVEVWDFQVRKFPQHRQEILERLVVIKNTFNPDLVFLPSTFDKHQDHAVVSIEGFRAFKHSTIFGYELPQNITSFNHSAYIALSEQEIEKKISALSKYESQKSKPYSSAEYIKGLALVRGVQINTKYAEAFEMIRLVIK